MSSTYLTTLADDTSIAKEKKEIFFLSSIFVALASLLCFGLSYHAYRKFGKALSFLSTLYSLVTILIVIGIAIFGTRAKSTLLLYIPHNSLELCMMVLSFTGGVLSLLHVAVGVVYLIIFGSITMFIPSNVSVIIGAQAQAIDWMVGVFFSLIAYNNRKNWGNRGQWKGLGLLAFAFLVHGMGGFVVGITGVFGWGGGVFITSFMVTMPLLGSSLIILDDAYEFDWKLKKWQFIPLILIPIVDLIVLNYASLDAKQF